MRVINLRAENIKRLVAVDITPDEHAVVISGKNGQGKTSVLDAIWFALGGGKAQADTPQPVRDGADGASVSLDLGEFTVERKWKADGTSSLKVFSNDEVFKSPQGMLDRLLGRLSFDPLAFAQAPPKEQLVTLLDLVELPFDPAVLDRQRAAVFDKRTDVNRQAKALRARLDAMPAPAGDVPTEEVSAADILAELQQAQARQQDVIDADRERARLEAEVDRLAEALATAEEDLVVAQQRCAALVEHGDLPDLNALQARLSSIDEVNAKVRARRARDAAATELDAISAEAAELTQQLQGIDDTKAKAIAEASMPIDGLGFDPDGVTYRGVPFQQCSGAEKLRVSLAMAMALNPEIRVVRITDASLLDDDGMRLVTEMAVEHDFQIWLERVGEGDALGIVIEDGLVKGAPEVKPKVEAF